GVDRRRRDHGRAPSHARRRGRAVPPRIDPDARGQAPARQLRRACRRRHGAAAAVTPKEALAAVVARRDLAGDELASAFEAVLAGDATPALVGGLLVGLRLKGETPEELAALARVLRRHAVPLPGAPAGAVDTCGTGGDGAGTFNISTAAALVV